LVKTTGVRTRVPAGPAGSLAGAPTVVTGPYRSISAFHTARNDSGVSIGRRFGANRSRISANLFACASSSTFVLIAAGPVVGMSSAPSRRLE
jgi:hypothetical protein